MKTFLLTLIGILAFNSNAMANPPVSVYDGFWIGKSYCSENIAPNANPKYLNAFNNNITFNMKDGQATATIENQEQINTFNLKIDANGNVYIKNYGNYKNNANRAWLIETIGGVRLGVINTKGQMTSSDKTILVRQNCGFDIKNNEVISNIEKYEESLLKNKAKPPQNTSKPVTVTADKPRVTRTPVAAVGKDSSPTLIEEAKPNTTKSPSTYKSALAVTDNPRVTQTPVAAVGKDSAPVRIAAIGNVQDTAHAKGSTNVTPNPIDKMSKKSSNDVWINFNPSITVQERQFCRLVENYRVEMQASKATQNQIKINEVNRNLVQALNSLLPDGKFQGWVMRSMSVGQASDGSADILFQLPCDVLVGSNSCDANPKNFYGTVQEGSRLYTELSKMTVGDFALVSGEFVYSDPKTFDKSRSVASYGFMKTADHCKAKSIPVGSDFFGIKMMTLSMIK